MREIKQRIGRLIQWFGCCICLTCLTVSQAEAALSLEPLTWNVIGLDSNDVLSGPMNFPVGTRVCSDIDTTNVILITHDPQPKVRRV